MIYFNKPLKINIRNKQKMRIMKKIIMLLKIRRKLSKSVNNLNILCLNKLEIIKNFAKDNNILKYEYINMVNSEKEIDHLYYILNNPENNLQ